MNFKPWYDELRRFDWSELADAESIGSWPAPIKVLVLLLLFCVCLGAGQVMFFRSVQAALGQALKDEAALHGELQSKRTLAALLPDEQREMEQTEDDFAASMRQLPERAVVPALLDTLAEMAQKHGLTLDELSLKEEMAAEFNVELPFTLVLRGDYHALGAFANDVAALPYLVVLRDFNIGPAEQGNLLRVTLSASIYRAAAEDHNLVEVPVSTTVSPSEVPPIYRAASLRNPFSPYTQNSASPTSATPDTTRAPEALEAFDLTQLSMSGTLERDGRRWALIRDANGSVTRVGIGARLGRDHGRIVRITRERIELIELVAEGQGWRERMNALALQSAAATAEAQGAQ